MTLEFILGLSVASSSDNHSPLLLETQLSLSFSDVIYFWFSFHISGYFSVSSAVSPFSTQLLNVGIPQSAVFSYSKLSPFRLSFTIMGSFLIYKAMASKFN